MENLELLPFFMPFHGLFGNALFFGLGLPVIKTRLACQPMFLTSSKPGYIFKKAFTLCHLFQNVFMFSVEFNLWSILLCFLSSSHLGWGLTRWEQLPLFYDEGLIATNLISNFEQSIPKPLATQRYSWTTIIVELLLSIW